MRKSFFWILFVMICSSADAQQRADTAGRGGIGGQVKDSVLDFMLISATVAVYRASDSSLMQFTVPNAFGAFSVDRLPLHMPLKLVITHVGYRPLVHYFSLSSASRLHLGTLYLHSRTDDPPSAEEIIVTAIAPMRMKGDTLEFNPDAFRLDSNATAEDLMRRLPGFTIWGDGEVTFNGKKLQAILVDGKPFFGSSMTVATKNLPKEIISKVQVYQQSNEQNPYDSVLFANIKLKEDKKAGYFGKLSAGAGTGGRYSADGMVSKYDKKMQLSLIGASNNVNKIAGNVDELIKASAFKGEGANIDYQPDLTIPGLNRTGVAGLKWQYNFLPDVTYFRKHRMDADYFMQQNRTDLLQNGFISTALGPDSFQTQTSRSNRQITKAQQLFNSRYEKVMSSYSFQAALNISLRQEQVKEQDSSTFYKTGVGIFGASQLLSDEKRTGKKGRLQLRYQRFKEGDDKKRASGNVVLEYVLDRLEDERQAQRKIISSSFINPAATTGFDRQYDNRQSGNSHTIRVEYPGLKRLIFGRQVGLAGIGISLVNTINIRDVEYNDQILDREPGGGSYKRNAYLTNNRHEHVVDQMPALSFFKNFSSNLTHRYAKYLNLSLNIKSWHHALTSSSLQNIQNIKYKYQFFMPDAQADYSSHQYGSHESKYSLSFRTDVNYPMVQQMAPLIDSSDYWSVLLGNRVLQPERERKLSLRYNFITRKSKNPFAIDMGIQLSKKLNAFSDSTLFDPDGRRYIYAVNVNGNRGALIDLSLKKSLEQRTNTLEIQLQDKLSLRRTPQFVNSVRNVSGTTSNDVSLNLDGSMRDRLFVRLQQGQSVYFSAQRGFGATKFVSNNLYSRLVVRAALPRRLLWSTDLTYHRTSFNHEAPIKMTILNAGLSYRFLKGEKGEAKFYALDLLRQNKNIINRSVGNTQLFSVTNTLQQYFMLTLSYYPRKFGK